MATEPFLELGPLDTGLSGDVEIPRLGTWDGRTVYCAYSQAVSSIWVQRTDDAGKTWARPVQAMGLSEPRYITDANLLVDRDRITLFATHVLDLPEFSGKLARSVYRSAVSTDGGSTWSAAEAMPLARRYVSGCIHAPVWLEGDTVVMGWSWDVPAEEGRPSTDEGGMHARAGLLISPDRGRTWSPGADVDLPGHAMGADEPAVVRLRNGDLFLVVRTTTGRPHETISHDGGLTWAPLRPAPVYGHNTPSALLRLHDGAILRAWNDSPINRFPLVVALSTDECQTWGRAQTVTEPVLLADGSLSYATACYPSLAQAADGTILLAWWQRSTDGRNSVWLARFNREWLDQAESRPRAQRIVAFGDSITAGVRPGVSEYQTFRFLLQDRLKRLGQPVQVLNAGVGSDNTVGALARLDRDVLAARPELVIVLFGMNDAAMVDAGPVARSGPRVPLADYRANLRALVTRIRASGAKVLLCTPTPMSRQYAYQHLGAYAQNEDMNFMLRQYALAAKDLGTELEVPVLDGFGLFAGTPEGLALIEDGCHPYVTGHALLAEAMVGPVRALLAGP
jgi:acyl-CoA thioesterase-1